MPNIFLGISGHGYGHLSQIIAVANKLLKYTPEAKFHIFCNLPQSVISERLDSSNFIHHAIDLDIGLVQPNPLDVDAIATLNAYKQFHATYPARVNQLVDYFKTSKIDIVIADIPYIVIEAAHQAALPSIAIASLTWDKIIENYLDTQLEEVKSFISKIRSSQLKASLALHPEPSMKLDSFEKAKTIPPIVLEGNNTIDLRCVLGIEKSDNRKIVLVSLGGIEADNIPIDSLKNDTRFHWLFNIKLESTESNLHSIYSIKNVAYRDLISSVDAVVGKPGYGTAVETVKYQLPFVFTCRGNFPDEPCIVTWLKSHSISREITRNEWLSGKFGDYLEELIHCPSKPQIECNGSEVAAKIIYDNFLKQ
jgi:hypothetical protein